MLKKQIKKIHINITTIIVCVIAIFAFGFHASAQVQFTEDTIISLSDINDGDLKVASSSECAELNISGAVLTITGIPIDNEFILKTESDGSIVHNNALKLTPTGGILGLILDSGSISSGNITQWTLSAEEGTTVTHIVGVPQENEYYNIKIGEAFLGSYQSSPSKEVIFPCSGGWSNKVFTIEPSNDNIAPVRENGSPNSALSANTTQTTLSLTTNETATCKYSTIASTAYASMTTFLTTTDNTTHSTTISGLTNNTNYNYYVKCQDTIDNINSSDYTISFSVKATAGGGIPIWMLNQINNANEENGADEPQDPSSANDEESNPSPNESGAKKNHFSYSQPRLKSLPQEQNSAKTLKQELEKHYGAGKIPVHKKHWHTIVNSYIYGNYPIQAIIQAIKFGGKTVHPTIPFLAWQKAGDYLKWIGR